jgi:hypothetical protein
MSILAVTGTSFIAFAAKVEAVDAEGRSSQRRSVAAHADATARTKTSAEYPRPLCPPEPALGGERALGFSARQDGV